MLAFVTSLRHPDNAKDYGLVERLLAETLESIQAQTSDEYVVIIVGNRAPSFVLPPKVQFVPVEFSAPAKANGLHADRAGFVLDKGSKIGVGLVAARQFEPDMVVIFDADDYVHRDLVRYVAQHPVAFGWVVEEGWVFSRGRNGFKSQPDFNRKCGTCFVLPYEAFQVSPSLTEESSQSEIVEAYGDVLPNIMGAHHGAVEWLNAHGNVLEPLPFRAAVYHVDTGENHSQNILRGVIRPWSRSLNRDFSIRAQRSRLGTLWSCFGPRAVAQSILALGYRLVRLARG